VRWEKEARMCGDRVDGKYCFVVVSAREDVEWWEGGIPSHLISYIELL